jgi:aminopeptidase N
MAIDIYEAGKKTRYQVWTENKADTFQFAVNVKPDLINVDGDKILLAEKKDNKTLEEFIYQYTYAGLYLDRREAIDFASKKISEPAAYQLVASALNDSFDRIRAKALSSFGAAKIDAATLTKIESMAKADAKRTVRADAIDFLGKQKNKGYAALFIAATKDSSYTLAGAGLEALAKIDSVQAFAVAQALSKEPSKGRLNAAISNVIIEYGDESAFDFILSSFTKMPLAQEKFGAAGSLGEFLEKVSTQKNFEKGVDELLKFRDEIPAQIRLQTDPYMNNMILKTLAGKKEATGAKAMADYINSKLPAVKK